MRVDGGRGITWHVVEEVGGSGVVGEEVFQLLDGLVGKKQEVGWDAHLFCYELEVGHCHEDSYEGG